MLSKLFAMAPVLLALYIAYRWHAYVTSKQVFDRVFCIAAAGVLTLTQIVATTLVLGSVGILHWWLLYAINIACGGMLYWRTNKAETVFNLEVPHIGRATLVVLGMAAALFARVVWIAVHRNDVSFDSVNYHLSWVALALQEGHLGPFSTSAPWINGYPKNLDIWYLWNLAPPVHDWLIDIMHLPLIVLGCLGLYALLQRLGHSQETALAGGLSFLFLPLVIQQATTNYIDAALAALVFVGLAGALQKESMWKTILIGCIGGLLFGSKATYAIAFAICILGAWLFAGGTPKQILRACLIAAALSWYWYVRNFLYFDYVFYPVKVAFGSFVLFPGPIDVATLVRVDQPEIMVEASPLARLYYNTFQSGAVGYAMSPGGFGALWSLLFVPAMLPALVLWQRTKNRMSAVIFALLWVAFFLSPANWSLRFVLFIVAAGILAYAAIDTALAKRGLLRLMLRGFLACLFLWSLSLSWWPIYADQSVFASLGTPRDFSYHYGPLFNRIAEVQNPGTSIAYDSSWNIIYPLWNAHRTNTVLHIPLQEGWYTLLKQQNVEYISAKSLSSEFTVLQNNPEFFQLVDSDDIYHLFKLQ